jgi:hypothetical protein
MLRQDARLCGDGNRCDECRKKYESQKFRNDQDGVQSVSAGKRLQSAAKNWSHRFSLEYAEWTGLYKGTGGHIEFHHFSDPKM